MSNGVVTYVRILRDALRSLGHRVTIVDTEQIEHSDGSIANLPTSSGLTSRVQTLAETWRGRDASTAYVRVRLRRAFEALEAADVEIVELEESWGWASRLVGRGFPVVMRLHGPHAFAREGVSRNRTDRLREASELRAFRQVQAVTSPSATVIAKMTEMAGAAQRTKVIYNPVPLPTGQWSAAKAVTNQLLFVGRFDSLKGADVVMRAFAIAVEKRPALRLILVGPDCGLGGTEHFDEFSSRLSLEIRSRIEFLGEQPAKRVAELRLKAALAIVGSRYETFPYTAFEAQAVGMPLLMTDTLGPRGIVTDGVDGRVVPVSDSDAMAKAIVEMVDDPAAMARMGAAGRAMVADRMDPMRVARETAQLYEAVLQDHRGERSDTDSRGDAQCA